MPQPTLHNHSGDPDYLWQVNIDVKPEYDGLQLPDVILCNYNRVKKSAKESMNLSDAVVEMLITR